MPLFSIPSLEEKFEAFLKSDKSNDYPIDCKDLKAAAALVKTYLEGWRVYFVTYRDNSIKEKLAEYNNISTRIARANEALAANNHRCAQAILAPLHEVVPDDVRIITLLKRATAGLAASGLKL